MDMEDFTLKFDGPTNQIEANTLINTLLHFTNLVQEIAAELDPTRKVEIKINAAPRPGSFLVDILFIYQNVIDEIRKLFATQPLATTAQLVTIVTGVVKFVSWLKGKKPEKVETANDSVKITTAEGNVTYIDKRVYNIYTNNKSVQQSVAKTFETLSQDPNVTGLELHGSAPEAQVSIPQEDFASIAAQDDTVLSSNEKVVTKPATLNILSLDWELKKKWEFYYDGNKITARIKDDAFSQAINRGERFAKGDSLEVELEIRQEFDEAVNTFINKSYVVQKVVRHIPRSEQSSMF